MRGLNKVCLIGYVGREPEAMQSEKALGVRFSLATDESRKDEQGEWRSVPEWHNLVCFGKTAEIARDYVKKGTRLYIEGRLQTQSYDDRDSTRKLYRTQIIVSELIMLGGPQEQQQASKPIFDRSQAQAAGGKR